jgi:ABC-type bacteriocin/lantibiotic exporter with double-glycine peptidase domain
MPPLRPPFYAQEEDNSCLAACLRMVLASSGIFHTEAHLRALCGWTPQRSITSTSVVSAALSLGFTKSREDYGLRLLDLRDALRRGIFPIVGIDLRSYGRIGQHALVVTSVTSRLVYVNDPLGMVSQTGFLTFEEAWSQTDFLTILIE